MDDRLRKDIETDLCDMIEADGYDAEGTITDIATEYEIPREEVQAIWDQMNGLPR